jgi:hypothetical protein
VHNVFGRERLRHKGEEGVECDMKRLGVLVGFLVIGIAAAIAPPGQPTEAQPNCYPTGFCIQNSQFLEYYRNRGEHNTLGYPASNEFTLEGFRVQIFQRVVLQINQGQVARLNLLDPGIMPMTRANQSIFPPSDDSLASAAPQVGSPDYARRVVEFVNSVAPNEFNGQPVNFARTFNTAVPVPPGTDPNIVTLLNLEIWGVPTSRPAADPGNAGFVYQRFQRGIMHYRNECRCTEGILIGEYFKAVLTGQNLPPDLRADMQGSRFLFQYDPSRPNSVARPNELPNTDLTNAFGAGVGPAPQPVPLPTQTPTGPTATPVPGDALPRITTFRVDDTRIDGGDEVNVEIIAEDDNGIDWIQFEGRRRDNDNENDNAAADPELDRKENDCDERPQCSWNFSIRPTVGGEYDLRARARDTAGQRSEWTEIELDVRADAPTNTPTTGPTSTPTTGPTSTPTTAPTATPTHTPGAAPKP